MNLEIVFKLSLYGLTALAGWILGVAEEGPIPFISLPAVVIGYLWTEHRSTRNSNRSRGMNDTLASICGFLALLSAMSEFFSENIEGRLLSGTHLVVYLTWIVLLQQKSNRRYWLLLALGVLQIAVASVLTSGRETVWFGLGAIAYVFGAIWTMSVFSLFRAASQFLREASHEITSVTPQPRHSVSIGSVQIEDGVTWISGPFFAGVTFTGTTGLFVSALFFALIPRVWIPAAGALGSDDTSPAGTSRSAFASEIRLGDMGQILESMDPVLQLHLISPTGTPLSPQDYATQLGLAEPLFRGSVLTNYQAPTWKVDPLSIQRPQRLTPSNKRIMVRQEIRLNEIGTDALLCLGTPSGLVDSNEQIRGTFQHLTGLIYRTPDFSKRGTIRYTVYSELPSLASASLIQRLGEMTRQRYDQIGYIEPHRRLPRGLERLSKLAQQIVTREKQRRGKNLSEIETARAIESYLRDSGEYSYTLHLSVTDPSIDPVEDFLFNRKTGHCEYFASSLALMLRAVGIPTRLISGYKGGNYDENTKTLLVQKRHAHAWCEAWIDNQGWVTLDATPADERTASVEAVSANRSLWNDMRSQLAGMWSDNVVNISLEKQEEVIYGPLREFVMSVASILKELWNQPNASMGSFFKLLVDPRNWFSWRGAGALLVIVGTVWLIRRAWRALRRWSGWTRQQPSVGPSRLIEFYERYARLMKLLGLSRAETQTQQEFAHHAASVLMPRLQLAGLACGPTEISDLFYKVRFGNEVLPEEEARRVEELLTGMERMLQPDRPTAAST